MNNRLACHAAAVGLLAASCAASGAAPDAAPRFALESGRTALREVSVPGGRFELVAARATSALRDPVARFEITPAANVRTKAVEDCGASLGDAIFAGGFEEPPLVVQ